MKSPHLILLHTSILSLLLSGFSVEAAERKKIVLIAGVKSHGPEGNRIHDYPWSVRLLKTMLEKSVVRDQVEVQAYFNDWPNNPADLESADTIMIISDGRDGDIGREAPHLATQERIQQVDRLMKRGCGIITFHFSTFAPDNLADSVLDWYGGYFDWETDGKREWYSKIETMEALVAPASQGHPVLIGMKPFEMREEFYFDIRFQLNDSRWKPIWRVSDLQATKPNGKVVAWAVERANGGRGFATTCGHFYDNWKHANFRKTMLNAIAWTSHIPIPENGIQSAFVDRDAIAEHLQEPDLIEAKTESADETVYADEPYWYKPGHPVNSADTANIETLPGFTVERVLTVPREFGSWTAVTFDNQGRLIASAQHRAGLYRITPAPIGFASSETKVEKLSGAAQKMGWSHGLLYAFDSLYVTVTEGNDETNTGVYRLRDTNGDDQFDKAQLLMELDAAGEHGAHNIVVGPDKNSLYIICGNGTKLPGTVDDRLPVATEGTDHLMPDGFGESRYTPAGWVGRFDPDGSDWTLIAAGLRNSFDLAFNRRGDLFTFDSDMEWDLGAPWYRPTRICHLVSGAEFGWRGDAAKWPEYFEDSVAPVVNIGPSSPTGVAFGYGTKFPELYEKALFACDWTFATIHAVHLEAVGGSYRARVEEFVGGNGLPVTDLVIGKDGAMYFTVGGRRLGSALYRVHYTGKKDTDSASADTELADATQKAHTLRQGLESFHGRRNETAIDTAWPHLGHPDRAIRFAARVAVETQPVAWWREKALNENNTDIQINALLALARQGTQSTQPEVIARLNRIRIGSLSTDQKLRLLRVYELALARGGDAMDSRREFVKQKLRPEFPDRNTLVNRELSRLLCHLGDISIIDPLLALMEADTGERPKLGSGYFVRNSKYGIAVRDMLESAPLMDRMHHAQMLLWIDEGWTAEQRGQYFEQIADAVANSKGGHQYRGLWSRIRESALEQIPENQRAAFQAIESAPNRSVMSPELAAPEGPGREWSMADSLELVGDGLKNHDFSNGKRMFAASGCVLCHQVGGEGGAIGPDLSTLGQRFTVRDILDSTINPSKAISDQYRITIIETSDGNSVSGRMVSRDSTVTHIATDLMRPSQSIVIPNASIISSTPVPVSTMPSGLLDLLNPNELLDLLAYLISGGSEDHTVFASHDR